MRTLRIAIFAFGLAALATTGCGKKNAPAAPMPENPSEPVEAAPADDKGPADDTATENPCAADDAKGNPCEGGKGK